MMIIVFVFPFSGKLLYHPFSPRWNCRVSGSGLAKALGP